MFGSALMMSCERVKWVLRAGEVERTWMALRGGVTSCVNCVKMALMSLTAPAAGGAAAELAGAALEEADAEEGRTAPA